MIEYFDDWLRKNEYISVKNEEIWASPYFSELVSIVRNNGDIEDFIKKKNQKLHNKYTSLVTENYRQEILSLNDKIYNNLTVLNDVDKTDKILNVFEQDIKNIIKNNQKYFDYNEDALYLIKDLLFSYYCTGVFKKNSVYNVAPKGLLNNIFKGHLFKKFNKSLDEFIDKYEKLNVYNTVKNLLKKYENNYSIRNIDSKFRYIVDLEDTDGFSHFIQDYKESLISEFNINTKLLEQEKSASLSHKLSFNNSKLIQLEDSVIRSFADEISQEIKNPKKFNSSDYISGLDKIQDDEIVMFNIGMRFGDKDGIKNVLKYNNMELGYETNQWCISHDSRYYEVFSPMMTARDAKKIMPKLIADFDRAHVSSGLIVPIKAKELFSNWSEKSNIQQINSDELKKLIIGAKIRGILNLGHKIDIYLQKYGFKNKDELPKIFNSLDDLKKQYPKDKFLFSGSTASDDYCLLSGRAGRNGTVYATPDYEYAMGYNGVADVGFGDGVKATNDKYVSNVIGKISDQDVKAGFINIYLQNEQDEYFSNFGMEDCRKYINNKEQPRIYDACEWDKINNQWILGQRKVQTAPNKRLTRDQAINGYVYNKTPREFDNKFYCDPEYTSETFVTPDKNPLVAKILHIKYDGKEFFISVDNNKKIFQDILDLRKAKVQDTFKYRDDIFKRLQKQKQDFDKGLIYPVNSVNNSFNYANIDSKTLLEI